MSVSYLKPKNPVFSRYTNGEFCEFMTVTLNEIPQDDAGGDDGYPDVQSLEWRTGVGASAISVSAELLDKFKEKLDVMLGLTRNTRSNIETAQLAEIDAARDKNVNFLLSRISVAADSPIEAECEAGKLLENNFKVYKGIDRLPVVDETGTISGMLLDFSDPKYASAIQQLGIQPVIDALAEQNEQYRTLSDQRRQNNLAAEPVAKTGEVREELGDLFEEILDRAFATNLLNESEKASAFLRSANSRIDEMKLRQKWRGSRDDSDTPDTDDSETPDTENPGTDDTPDDLPVVQ